MDVFFPIYLSQKTAHGCFFHLLKSEDNTRMFFPFHLLKPEDNTWMFFSFHLLKSENNTWMFFLSIYLSLKTTHECLLSFHLLMSEDNTWMFFFPFT